MMYIPSTGVAAEASADVVVSGSNRVKCIGANIIGVGFGNKGVW